MIFRRFDVALVLRLVLVGIAMTAFIWLLLLPGYHSAMALVGGALVCRGGEAQEGSFLRDGFQFAADDNPPNH